METIKSKETLVILQRFLASTKNHDLDEQMFLLMAPLAPHPQPVCGCGGVCVFYDLGEWHRDLFSPLKTQFPNAQEDVEDFFRFDERQGCCC